MDKIEIDIPSLMEGTKDMDATEFGAYMLLLFESYRFHEEGYLVKEKEFLKRICRCTPEQWVKQVIPNVFKKFKPTPEGNYIYNNRAIKEVQKEKKKREKKENKNKLSPEQRDLERDCFAIYKEFYNTRLPNSKPKINVVQIKALREMIRDFKKGNNTDEYVVSSFKLIFEFMSNLELLPKGLHYMIKLSDIASKIDNILWALETASKSPAYNIHIEGRSNIEQEVNDMIEKMYEKGDRPNS